MYRGYLEAWDIGDRSGGEGGGVGGHVLTQPRGGKAEDAWHLANCSQEEDSKWQEIKYTPCIVTRLRMEEVWSILITNVTVCMLNHSWHPYSENC